MPALTRIQFLIATILTITALLSFSEPTHGESDFHAVDLTHGNPQPAPEADRLWCISTRGITSQARCADLDSPNLSVTRIGAPYSTRSSLQEYFDIAGRSEQVVIYVHGNRMDSCDVIPRALSVYRKTLPCRQNRPIDWVIWSWPSAKVGCPIEDVRVKASRTDAQGLYLAWLLRNHVDHQVPTTLIGYSFGGRVVTGALHALAGGKLSRRGIPNPPVTEMRFDVGLVAPAIESQWMSRNGYHQLATQNLDRLLVLYNRRDAVLKRYWLIDRVRGSMALGYSGPRSFAPRADGSKISLIARDCSVAVGRDHRELNYYDNNCRAGSVMAQLIDDIHVNH